MFPEWENPALCGTMFIYGASVVGVEKYAIPIRKIIQHYVLILGVGIFSQKFFFRYLKIFCQSLDIFVLKIYHTIANTATFPASDTGKFQSRTVKFLTHHINLMNL